ncbi:hypothetical protein [Desulfosarcina cetonica]|uniref:hypothetical protein n=1 Tax=Desulfosarcina cetonica TaxID=90730 RepID=UPI0006D2A34A|nr:hypothetical protein [Desulfosarcina cetonica]
MENEFIEALKPTPIIDSDDPHVIAFTHRSAKGAVDDKARASDFIMPYGTESATIPTPWT